MTEHDRQFEGSLDDGLRDLDRRLRATMRVGEPAGLCDRVEAACHGADAEKLRRALRVEVPAGLAERAYVASVRPARAGVLGRIGPVTRWAAAACILLAAGWGTWAWRTHQPPAPSALASIDRELVQTVREVRLAKPQPTELDDHILAFALDVERTALSMDVDLLLDPLGMEADILSSDLYHLEADYDAF